jgi:hypothetical protein
MKTTELIQEIKSITQANLESLRSSFLLLNNQQKNWKINENSWSISEVFAHLNHYATFYHSAFIERIGKTRFTTPSEVFISSPLGRSAWKSMKLGNAKNLKRRFKSPKASNPRFSSNILTENSTDLFEQNLLELQLIIESAEKVNLKKVRIPISISQIIRLRLGDALLFVVYHNERHVQQALNTLNHPNFPK